MRRVRRTRLAAVLAVFALALTACGGSGGDEADRATSILRSEKVIKVGLAYDVGGPGDKSFNDAAFLGLQRTRAALGVEVKDLEADLDETDADKEARLKLLAGGGFDLVIAVGFAYSKALATVAKEYPDVAFAIIDDAEAKGANIANLVFADEQGSFLVGAAAALKSKTGTVGFMGAVRIPLIQKFEAGFLAGARAARKDIKVKIVYLTQPPDFSGFSDPAKGRAAAGKMYDDGADVVYGAAGGSNAGMFQAAAARTRKLAVGVDSDQFLSADPAVRRYIVTSMLKRVDVAVADFIKTAVEGEPATGQVVYDLKKEGVGYAVSGGGVDDIATKLDDYKQQIIDGTITVPDKPAGA